MAEMKVDKLSRKTLRRDYGISAAILDENPELDAVLKSILKDQRNGIEYEAKDIASKIQNTDWFKRHTSGWMTVQKDRMSKDPAIWNSIVTQRAEKITEAYTKAGATIDDATARDMAEKMIYGSGWQGDSFEIYDENWMTKTMAKAIDFTKTKTVNGVVISDLSGSAEETAQQLYEMADAYGYNTSMTDDRFASWFNKSLRGVMDGTVAVQDVDDELKENAISRFPGFAKQLQRGLTLKEAADPYMKTIAEVLEFDTDAIDLNDNLVQKVLNNVDGDGNFKPMSLYDARLAARSDSRWQYTSKAKTEYTGMANQILKDFGFLG